MIVLMILIDRCPSRASACMHGLNVRNLLDCSIYIASVVTVLNIVQAANFLQLFIISICNGCSEVSSTGVVFGAPPTTMLIALHPYSPSGSGGARAQNAS